jgi:uncharacterized repeat protein (TIGR01451 family)
VAVDAGGDLLITDINNQVVRLVAAADCAGGCPYGLASTTKGDIYTVAGTGAAGFSNDGVPATSAELNHPEGVAVDGAGDLLIGDSANNRVRLALSELGSLAAADLSIINSAPSSVVSGNTLTYTITAANNGGQDATGVTVTDPLSGNEHLNVVSASTTQGTCTTKAATVKCSVGTLSGRSNATITIVAIATTPGTFKDTATVTASNVTPDPDDSSTATTTVIGT